MSAMGHKQTSRDVRVTSALPPIADIRRTSWHVRLCHKQTWSVVLVKMRAPAYAVADFIAERQRWLAQASDSPIAKPSGAQAPRSLANFFEFGFLFRSDLTSIFKCFDALRGEFLAVVLHTQGQQLTSESVLVQYCR